MTRRDIGLEILEGIREIKAHNKGTTSLKTYTLKTPAHPRQVRETLGLSQAEFAAMMNVSVRTIQDWEQERRKPSGPAVALLRIAEQKPEVFLELK